jgi:hypothetical protein
MICNKPASSMWREAISVIPSLFSKSKFEKMLAAEE